MTIINPNSISGISSITALNSTAAINLFKADGTSANIIAGVTTGSNFITGTSNVHSTGYECTNINASGIITATSMDMISTDAGSSAAPEFKLYRNSASPADADYLGQIKFAGESDTGVERNYAKITGKILDASNGTEDGILEFAHIKAGSQTITGRWRSDSLQLLNDTNLSVAGDTTLTGDLDVDGHTELDNVNVVGVTTFNEDISFKGANFDFLYDRSLNTLKFDQGIAAFGTSGQMTLQNQTIRGVTQIQAGGLYIKNLTGQQMISCYTGGQIELYHNNTKKFETTGAGVTVTNGHLQQQYGGIASKVGYVSGGAEAYFGSTSNHSLVLGTNNTERLRITTSGSIGLNGANYGSAGQVFTSQGSGSAPTWSTIPGTTINSNADNRVITGSGTANTLNAEGNFLHDASTCDTTIQHYEALKVVDLIIKNTNNHGNAAGARVTIESGSAANTGPQFQMICGSHSWSMQVPKAAGNLEFNNNGSLAFRMNNDNNFLVNDGDVIIGTAGHGIDFSARGNAGGMTSELLDHYEEGSWTPSIYPMSSNIPVTYTTRVGQYTRIGNVVYWQLKIQVSNITGNRNQGFGISGFPYNINNTHDQCSSEFYGETWDGEIPTTIKYISNTNRGVCYYYADAMKYYASSMLDINVSSSVLLGSGHYFV